MTADRNTRIQERAYHLWLEEDRPHGRHEEHWRRAERELIEAERGLPDVSEGAVPYDDGEAVGAPAASVGQAASVRAEDRPGGKSPTTVPAKAKPRAARSRPAASGSGSRGSRRSVAAKPAE